MKARQATIEKYYNFLKVLVKLQNETSVLKDLPGLIKQYKLNTYTSSTLIHLGYVQNGNNRTFKVVLMKPEPRHAKAILDFMNTNRQKNRLSKKVEMKTSKPNKVSKTVKPKVKTVKSVVSERKEFSLLWGLIKVKF